MCIWPTFYYKNMYKVFYIQKIKKIIVTKRMKWTVKLWFKWTKSECLTNVNKYKRRDKYLNLGVNFIKLFFACEPINILWLLLRFSIAQPVQLLCSLAFRLNIKQTENLENQVFMDWNKLKKDIKYIKSLLEFKVEFWHSFV